MVRKTDDSEAVEFRGMVTVIPLDNPLEGDGSLEIQGSIYADNIESNTIGDPLLINGVSVLSSTLTLAEQSLTPIPPLTTDKTFFVKDSLLKDINNSGLITTYQPITTKGDLATYDNILQTQTRLPVGNPGTVLVADPTTNTGLNWATPKQATAASNSIFISGQNTNNSVVISNAAYSSVFASISPQVKDAYSGIFAFSKSRGPIKGNIVKLTSSPAISQSGTLEPLYDEYSFPEIYKTYNGNGSYLVSDTNEYSNVSVNLTGTAWVQLPSPFNVLTGAFSISVFTDTGGPSANFLICKSIPDSTGAIINRISSSPGISGGNLLLRWNANTGIEISKTSVGQGGEYKATDNFQLPIITNTITLSGTTPIQLFDKKVNCYQQRNRIIRIYSSIVANSPCSIYFVSKTSANTTCGSFSVRAPGKTTLELITVSWTANSLISISKTGANYDGIYILEIL